MIREGVKDRVAFLALLAFCVYGGAIVFAQELSSTCSGLAGK